MRPHATRWLAGLACLALQLAPTQASGEPGREPDRPNGSGGINAPGHRQAPYLVLVSIDGFRWDYLDTYRLPAIAAIAAGGVRAERLVPVWPSLTFPNHYSIVTGMQPARHGLVSNDFFDPQAGRWYRMRDRGAVEDGSFYGGEPIWVTAETQGMVAASFFWVGSEADVAGIRPTHWRSFDKRVSGEQRVDQVLAWLAQSPERRPHLYTLYFEDVDDHSHGSGIGSQPFLAALQKVDGYLARLLAGIEALPHAPQVYLALVSDHGQLPYANTPALVLEERVDLAGLELVDGGAFVFGWPRAGYEGDLEALAKTINRDWAHGRAYLRDEAPGAWRLAGNPRWPSLIVQADPGHAVLSSAARREKISAADHGWAPGAPDMHGIFIARGPGIRPGQRLGPVHVTDLYPLFCAMLGLRPAGDLDSDPAVFEGLLESARSE